MPPSKTQARKDLIAGMTDREYDLARALARVTCKLQAEFEKSQTGLPAKERMTWPDCWAEAQDGWDTLVSHGIVDARRRPHMPDGLGGRRRGAR